MEKLLISLFLFIISSSLSAESLYEQCLYNYKDRTQGEKLVKLNRDEIYKLINKNTLDMSGMNIFIDGKDGERGTGFNEIDRLKFTVKNKKLTGVGGALQYKNFVNSSLVLFIIRSGSEPVGTGDAFCFAIDNEPTCMQLFIPINDLCGKSNFEKITLFNSHKERFPLYQGDYFNIKSHNKMMSEVKPREKTNSELLAENPILAGILGMAIVGNAILSNDANSSSSGGSGGSSSSSIDWERIDRVHKQCKATRENCYAHCEGLPTNDGGLLPIPTLSSKGRCEEKCRDAYKTCKDSAY